MEPISSPELESEAPPAGAPGQVIGPGGSVLPTQIHIPQPTSPPIAPSTPAVTISPTTAHVAPPTPSTVPPDPLRPTAVGDSLPAASSVILPPQPSTFGAMSYNETIASTKTPFIKKLATKKMLLMLGLPLVVLGSSAAAYFGYVMPNQPDNIWAKALSNTGKGYDKLSDYSQKQFYSNAYKGLKADLSFKIDGSLVADGSFHGASDGDNGEFSGSVSASGLKFGLDLRAIKSSTDTPDLYIKVDGLNGLASLLGGQTSDYSDIVKNVDGNWYFIDHTLFEQYSKESGTDMSLSQADVKSILDAIGTASKQNVFTSDQAKMAFQVKQKIGKEKQDGRNVYHFKVGVDKQNLKTYITNLCSDLKNASGIKKLTKNDSSELDSFLDCASLKDSVDNIKDGQTADAWVDMRTKLIHKVRITDSSNPNSYFDFGQDYQGGDEFPFAFSVYDKEGGSTTTGGVNFTLNIKTGSINMKGSIKEAGDDPANGSFDLTVTPSNDKVNVQKPSGAKDFGQLSNDLGLNDLLNVGFGGQSQAEDTERKTDINAMHGQVEAYDAQYGYYPSLSQMNDPNWRAKNLQGLDSEALRDPGGSAPTLAAKPAANAYSYETVPAGCTSQCTDYTLTATLSDGTTYVKQALDPGDSSSSILN